MNNYDRAELRADVQTALRIDGKGERRTFNIFGNYGSITVDSITGIPLHFEHEEGTEDDYSTYGIILFAVVEFMQYYGIKEMRDCDIVDIGFWFRDANGFVQYEEAIEDHRNGFMQTGERSHGFTHGKHSTN